MTTKNETTKKIKLKYSRFLLAEPLPDETKERLWLALEQIRVIFTSEELIVEFALHELIVELAGLTLASRKVIY